MYLFYASYKLMTVTKLHFKQFSATVFFQGLPKISKLSQKIPPGRKTHYIIFQGFSKRKLSVQE